MRNRRIEIAINLFFWLATTWIIAGSFSIVAQEIELVEGVKTVRIERSSAMVGQLLLCIGFAALLFYVNRWIVSGLNRGWSAIQTLLYSLLSFAVITALYHGVQAIVIGPDRIPLPPNLRWGILTFYFAISAAYGMARVWVYSEQQRQRLALEKKQAELNLLRSQLRPHFLFNMLNNLLAMVDQQANPQLARSLDQLSSLLRYVIHDTTAATVPVKREIDFIRDFAELQALRFEKEEVDFQLDVTGTYDEQPLEPGIFIPFVENAFKYGTEPERRSRIRAEFDLSRPDRIVFRLRNPIFPLPAETRGTGTGLRATRKRLQLVYPQAHELNISANGLFRVELKINTHASHHSR